jgi:hypothetical protein
MAERSLDLSRTPSVHIVEVLTESLSGGAQA